MYYLSAEFLQGRSLLNAVLNLGIEGEYAAALKALGTTLEEAVEQENNAALGNGGLGRLVRCSGGWASRQQSIGRCLKRGGRCCKLTVRAVPEE